MRWVHQGRSVHGIDCIGLVVACVRACGLPVRDRTDYGRDPDGTLVDALDAHLVRVDDRRLGDVALIEYAPGVPRHVGILGSNGGQQTLIHADTRHGRVVEHPLCRRWQRRIVGVWRLP